MERLAKVKILEKPSGNCMYFLNCKAEKLGNTWNLFLKNKEHNFLIGITNDLVTITNKSDTSYSITLRRDKVTDAQIYMPEGVIPVRMAVNNMDFIETELSLTLNMSYKVMYSTENTPDYTIDMTIVCIFK